MVSGYPTGSNYNPVPGWNTGQMPNLKMSHERRLGRQAVYRRDIIVCLIKEGNVISEVIFGTVSVSTKLLSKRFLEGTERLTNSKFSTTFIFIQCLVVFHFPIPHPVKIKKHRKHFCLTLGPEDSSLRV